MTAAHDTNVAGFADSARDKAGRRLRQKEVLEQYFSSAPLARMMASMMKYDQKEMRVLDPGAGAGALFAACVERACAVQDPPERISVTAYEIDRTLSDIIEDTLDRAGRLCDSRGIRFDGRLIKGDFIGDYADGRMAPAGFTHVIANPPYKKINTSSEAYSKLRAVNLETTNMYAAFISISCGMLEMGGQMAFISPRSFCNGSYFHRFRKRFLESMSVQRIHLFQSRTASFQHDGVLQENVILCAKKVHTVANGTIVISSSMGPEDSDIIKRRARRSEVIPRDGRCNFIHIAPDEPAVRTSEKMDSLLCTLEDLGIEVSTGKVMDFRIRDHLKFHATDSTVPLVRPFNISDGTVRFPIHDRKHHNFIIDDAESRGILVEDGNYVLVKRFTTTEERKRIVASVWVRDGHSRGGRGGFENRVNYFHAGGGGMPASVAVGLWAFLNSTTVDEYFRQFNGSTQVNASDLRYIKYPTLARLRRLGSAVRSGWGQKEIDNAVEGIVFNQQADR